MQEMVLDNWEVGHTDINQGSERIDSSGATILCDDNIPPPRIVLGEGSTLNLADGLVNRERGACPRD